MARKIAVEIVGDSSSLTRAFSRSSSAAKGWNKDLRQVSRGTIAATIGFTGLGRALALASGGFLVGGGIGFALKSSVEGFTKFEDTMQKTIGLAGVMQSQVKGLSKQILDLAPVVGKSPQELAQAFYFIASSGIAASKAIEVLNVSARGAVAGLGDTVAVADAITSVLNAYGQANISAAEASDVLIATVREGKGEAAQFAPVIGNVVALAAKLGVSFDQVGAALAAQTRLGTDAETAAIQLQRVFSSLLKVTPQSAEAFKSVGLNADKLRDELGKKGLIFVLKEVKAAFGENIPALAKAFGDVRGLRGVLNLVGNQAAATSGVFDRLAHSAGSIKTAFDAVSKDTAQQFRRLKAAAEVTGITLGAMFAPLAAKTATALTKTTLEFNKFVEKINARRSVSAKFDFFLTGLKNANLKVQGEIVRLFNKIDFSAAGRVFSQKMAQLLDGMINNLQHVKWDKVGQAIVRGIATFIAHVNWIKLGVKTILLLRAAINASASLLVGAGKELMLQLLKGIQFGAKFALLEIEKFVFVMEKKIAGATSFLGRFDPFKGVRERAAKRIKEIQAEIDKLRGKNITVKITSQFVTENLGGASDRGDSVGARQKRKAEANAQAKDEATAAAEAAAARARAAAAAARAAEAAKKAKEKAIEAFKALIDSFSLQEEEAAATKTLKDDIAVQKRVQAAIIAEMKVEGKTTDLQRQLFESRQKVTEFEKQILENKAAAKKRKQFLSLGLTAEGDEPTPSAGALRKKAKSLKDQIKGTVLDTPKTAKELARIAAVLSGKFGKVGRDVRAAILQMLQDIQSALDDKKGKGPLTKTKGLNSKKILEGLGLTPEQINELRGRLSHFNTGGRALAGSPQAGGGGGFVGGPIVVESNVTVNLDGQKLANVVTKKQQKNNRRNPRQKRGPNRRGF